ncbi:MAG TPA: SAM-dependent methyltransferase [Flavipsychrobacter sp.]|nr:SAM-dependent methyltransferase [Flavipsychrobacter sp.]
MAVYLIPIPIAEGKLDTLSRDVYTIIPSLQHFFIENTRTARRFIKSIYPEADIDAMQFSEIDKHNGADMRQLKEWLKQGKDIGVMSESGCPGIADPGADLVALAQEMEIRVVPLVGPSSVLLALMASGFNGQRFCFNGYLPIKEPLRGKAIKELEQYSQKNRQTQIFIETPYRNNSLLNDFLKHCSDNTRLCIAYDITGEAASIITKTIKQWKQEKPVLEKQPCVFLLLA